MKKSPEMVWLEMVGHGWVSRCRRGEEEEEEKKQRKKPRKEACVRGEGGKKKKKNPGSSVREKLDVLYSF